MAPIPGRWIRQEVISCNPYKSRARQVSLLNIEVPAFHLLLQCQPPWNLWRDSLVNHFVTVHSGRRAAEEGGMRKGPYHGKGEGTSTSRFGSRWESRGGCVLLLISSPDLPLGLEVYRNPSKQRKGEPAEQSELFLPPLLPQIRL